MRKTTILVSLLVVLCSMVNAQVVTDLFASKAALSRDFHNLAREYQPLELNTQKLQSLRSQAPENLKMQLPFENGNVTLSLKKVKITSDNFSVIEALPNGGRRTVAIPEGIYYQGKIDGKTSSFATISLAGDRVMGIIADERGNIVLGAIEDNGVATREYTLYRERNMKIANRSQCYTQDIEMSGITTGQRDPATGATGNTTGEPIDIYFECDFKFYNDKGQSTTNVINYVLGFFNNTALLYANEDIKAQVSQILVWTTQDPEAGAGLTTTSACLNSFRDRMAVTSYVGDYAHLLSTRNLGGGIAYILGSPCTTEKKYKTAVSAIENSYANFPTYSWTVEVVTHELGHNFGSNHTQWCGWIGGAIDNCVPTEALPGQNACPGGPTPTNGGTIMSYCHLTSNGINFNNGFGPQPGGRIREVIGNSPCIGNCRMTITIAKQDASCNQNNGSATVTALNNTGTLSYLWSNGQTGATLTGAAPGTYHVTVSDAGGCQVMEDVTLVNNGSNLTFSLTPSGTAGFCTGQSAVLTATSNPNFTYQWSLGGNPIAGATANLYTATSGGTYSVKATSGVCSGTQSVVVTEVAPPTAAVAVGGATSFCSGNSVTLTGNIGTGYSYQWLNNGAPIAGAATNVYTATTSGSYSLKVFVGTSCEAISSATVVNVSPSPSASITASGPITFCAGNSVDISVSAGTGYIYQWYRGASPINGEVSSTYHATTGGVYSVLVTLGTCNKTSANTTVVVAAVPTVTVTPVAATIHKYESQTLTASGAVRYNWSIFPSLVADNGTSADFKPLTTTEYQVEGTAENGCKDVAVATINVIGCGEVTDMTIKKYSPSRVYITWMNPPGVTTDSLEYRKVGEATWHKLFVDGVSYELNGLDPASNYEYALIPLCTTTDVFIPSASQPFTTDGLDNGLYIRLLPNPVKSRSRLEIISSTNYSLDVAIYDNAGKLVTKVASKQNLSAGQTVENIVTDHLTNGVYIIGVSINGKMQQVKMLVSH